MSETVANKIIHTANVCRLVHAIAGALVALVLIGGGYALTQRQFTIPQNGEGPTEITLKASKIEFQSKSTYPGIALIVCGTFIACTTILKKYRAKTQHKDANNDTPGFTEVES